MRSARDTRPVKAAYQTRYGPPEVVELRDIERPVPSEGQVLIRVKAASVNRADLDGLKPKPGFIRLFAGLRAPRSHGVGLDAAGVVETVGPGVTRFRPGDAVMIDMFAAGQDGGAFAEYLVAREKAFEPIPTGMSFEEAAALPHSAVLAIQGLRLRSGRTIQPGDKVLVDGASGNVGPFVVQIAKAMGAEVTGVASGGKLDFVRSLGADHVIDYRAVDYTKAGKRYDWIVAVDAHHSILRVGRALEPNGVYLTMGGDTGSIFSALMGEPPPLPVRRPVEGPHAVVEADAPARRGCHQGAHRGRQGAPDHRSPLPAVRGRGRPPLRRGRQAERQGDHHRRRWLSPWR